MIKKIAFCVIINTFLIGCGINNNITTTVNNGYCPWTESFNISNGGNPYCVEVELTNNGGGQNFITSTNYKINNLIISVTGASNILTPTNNASMDPNGCSGSNINPGASCTFYLKIGNESYAVNSFESITVNINYTINNSLFGESSANKYFNSSFNLFQYTSIYLVQQNGFLWIHNTAGDSYGWAESADIVNNLAVDTNSFGILYFGGNVGIYPFAPTNYTSGKSITNNGSMTGGTNNIYTSSGNLYATGLTGSTGLWSYSLGKQTWNSNSTINSLTQPTNTNANTLSTSGNPYFAIGGQVFACPNNTSTSNSCQVEGNPIQGVTITRLAFNTSTGAPYTGLYAGTNSGLYIESGVTPSGSASWSKITTNISNTVNVTSMVSNKGELFIGDSNGNIWLIENTSPTTPVLFASIAGNQAITNMVIDVPGNTLYFTKGSSALLSCSLSQTNCLAPTAITTILPSLITNSPPVGLAIGSVLTESVVPFYGTI